MASLGRKSRVASVISVVLALLLVSLAICAPAARAQSWGEVVLHSFAGTDGADPEARLIQGSDGNFYGTTEVGGANPNGFQSASNTLNGPGTVFKLTPSGRLTTLYSFCSVADPINGHCTDGTGPRGLIQSSDGNFYGTTEYGGANPNGVQNAPDTPNGPGGTVFKLTPSGRLTTLYSFCSQAKCTDGADPDALIQGSDGNFYGTTTDGGANSKGTVFKLTPSGRLTTLYSFCSQANCTDGETPSSRLIQGIDGNLYGTTFMGGAEKAGTVFKITPSGTLTTVYSFCSVVASGPEHCLDGAQANGLIQGRDGNFYGTTTDGGANLLGGTVFKLTPLGTLTTLYSFCSVPEPGKFNCLDGFSPTGLTQGSDGNFYGTTAEDPDHDSTVFKLTPSGRLTTLHSFCSQRYTCTCTDGDAPNGLIQGIDGNFYGTTTDGGANGYDAEGFAGGYGTVFEVGASLPTPTNTPTATSTPGHITVIPNESACDVSKAKADDLLALAPLESSLVVPPNSPSVKCTVEGLSPASHYCDKKTEIVQDQMLGQGRRLIVRRTTYTGKSRVDDDLLVFGCAFGRVVRILANMASARGGEMKIEHADPNEIIYTGPPTPPGSLGPRDGRLTLEWDAKIQGYVSSYWPGSKDRPPPLANTLPCGELKTARANDLIILANHEFHGGFGGFPFTQGVGCYDHDDWKVTLDKDRMISANRREIFFHSDHLSSRGTWGYSYVFGCVAGQVRLAFGTADLPAVRSACDEQAPPESGHQAPPASPTSGYNCASWEDSRSDQLTFIAACTTGECYCSACGASGEEVMTFKWSPELNNYVLTSVNYRPRSRGD